MSKFLKLSRQIINVNYITRIVHDYRANPNAAAYTIYINELDISGAFMFGFGWLNNTDARITFNSVEHFADYDKIRHWLETSDTI